MQAGPPAGFTVSGPGSVLPGNAFSFTVSAVDQFGNATPAYTGTVHFSSTDPMATLPADTTLTNGTGTFTAILQSGGSQTLTAADTINSVLTGNAIIGVAVINGGVTINIPTYFHVHRGDTVTVPVDISSLGDAVNGNDGLSAANLVVYYDPSVFTVTDSDINLGTIPGATRPVPPTAGPSKPIPARRA